MHVDMNKMTNESPITIRRLCISYYVEAITKVILSKVPFHSLQLSGVSHYRDFKLSPFSNLGNSINQRCLSFYASIHATEPEATLNNAHIVASLQA